MSKDFSTQISYPLGMRNNNPGNLRPGSLWLGSAGSNEGFVKFTNMKYGLRAMALDLSNKITKDGLTTITEIITKYAPPSENDTQAYIDSVSNSTGWGANDQIILNEDNLTSLIRAQMNVEQGAKYSALLSDYDIREGIEAMPDTIFTNVQNFFVDNPEIATVSGLGLLAVAGVVALIVFRKGISQTLKSIK